MDHVSLVVDYGNGAMKTFMNLPWTELMTIPDVLAAAGGGPPGLLVEDFTDRGGRRVVRSIDGVESRSGEQVWLAWVGTTPFGDRLPTDLSDHLAGSSRTLVPAGAVVLLKLSEDKT